MTDTSPFLDEPVGFGGGDNTLARIDRRLEVAEVLATGVKNRTTTTPPANPAKGDAYIVPSGATGAWNSFAAGSITWWSRRTWQNLAAVEGMELYCSAEKTTVVRGATAWVATEGAQILTDGATISWDSTLGRHAYVQIAGNRTMGAPSGTLSGGHYTLMVAQDITGSRTITWNAVFKWANLTAPTLSTNPFAIDQFHFVSYFNLMFEDSRSIRVL